MNLIRTRIDAAVAQGIERKVPNLEAARSIRASRIVSGEHPER